MLNNHVLIRHSTLKLLVAHARMKAEGTLIREAIAEAERCESKSAGVRPMLDASTDHLSEADRSLLDRLAGEASTDFRLPRVVKHEYGWCVFLSCNDEGEGDGAALLRAGSSVALANLVDLGAEVGGLILNFDTDAEEIPGIPVHGELAEAV